MTIVEFLLARLEADEAVAQAISLPAPSGWETDEGWCDESGGTGRVESSVTRVLAECAAKREIVELHPEMFGHCRGCADETFPCRTLAALAQVYSTHPDYQPEWN